MSVREPDDDLGAGELDGAPGQAALIEADPADVQEQRAPVGTVTPRPAAKGWMDANEADALEQSMEVPLDDDADRP